MRRRPAPADGFTLTELLVAITILGIIMGSIGAMITTAFRTSSTVSSELNGSRGPKSVSQYWVPDVERAETVELKSGGCGDTGSAIVTFVSHADASAFDDPTAVGAGGEARITWSDVPGSREQLVRTACVPGKPVDTTVVVADLDHGPEVTHEGAVGRYRIHVAVPDRSQQAKVYEFTVDGTQQITSTTTTAVPGP